MNKLLSYFLHCLPISIEFGMLNGNAIHCSVIMCFIKILDSSKFVLEQFDVNNYKKFV